MVSGFWVLGEIRNDGKRASKYLYENPSVLFPGKSISEKSKEYYIFAGNELTFYLWWKIRDISLN